MTTEPQVTHPPVTHPETITPDAPTTPREGAAKPAPRHAATRTARPAWRMPPPKVIAAVVLVAVALELLLWQVAGVFWGLIAHAILAVVALATVAVLVRRRRAQQRAILTAARTLRKAGTPTPPAAGKNASGPLARLFRRSGRATGGASGKRGGLLGRRSGGAGRGLFGRRSGAGGSSRGGLLGKLTGGGRRAGAAGRATGAGRVGSGRAGGLLGRLGRKSASRAATGGASGRRAGVGAALGRMRSSGRSLLGRSRPAGRSATRPASASRATKRSLGGLFGRKAAKPTGRKTSPLAGFVRGVRESVQGKPAAKKPSPGPQHKAAEAKPAPPVEAQAEKPQPPTKEQLVKEAVQRAAKVKPAAATPQPTGGTSMGDIGKIRAAADEFAAALKDYDPESMHQLVRDMPQLGEALSGIQQGFRQVASRAESEWPVAAPVAEGLRSIADDIKAGAGTAEETRGTIRRENETDIERGEAPRHGSVEVERKWNV